jgi:hypothetical protein
MIDIVVPVNRTCRCLEKEEDVEEDLDKYQLLKEYLAMFELELRMLLRMIDTILEDVESVKNMLSSTQLCLNVRDQAVRIHSTLTSRIVALEDLISILRTYGIQI